MPKLLIVESPKKAQTIQKFIGKDWIVRASFGHIRQLAKDGDFAELGVAQSLFPKST